MTIIEQIKAEIERRRLHFNKEAEKYQAINNGYSQNCYGARDALRDLENFLSALESEKPMQDGLEEEIVKVCDDFVFPLYGLDDEFGRELINKIARHFAEWGAEHLKK